MASDSINQISENLLLAVKKQKPTSALITDLGLISCARIKKELTTDNIKKAFWINIYNSFFQILRKIERIGKGKIFTQKLIYIGKFMWSLDEIEHGILRKYRHKYSLGYLPQLFVSDRIRQLAVSKIDYRIHFALNCGAKSYPPIAFYSAEKIDQQLEAATLSFLDSETEVDNEKMEIRVSRLFLWFLADFGGKQGVWKILTEKLQLDTTGFKLVYKSYSWEEHLDNYVEAEMAI